VLGVTLEITERVEREREVQRSLSLLNATLESSVDGIVAVDETGRPMVHNRRFMELWSLTEEDLETAAYGRPPQALLDRLKNPETFLARAAESVKDPQQPQTDIWELRDGRIIERRAVAQRLNDEVAGRVISMRDVTSQRRAASLLEDQARILERVARGVPLEEILDDLCGTVEEHAADTRSSVLTLNTQGELVCAAAPSLRSFFEEFCPVVPAPDAGSCGAAVDGEKPALVHDLMEDARWAAPHRDLASRYGLRSSWSLPIRSSSGVVVGSFAVYRDRPGLPGADEIRLIEMSASLAGVVIERDINRGLQRDMEHWIHQAEKMESVGQLAGGLAHDLGNVLSVVTINSDLLQDEIRTARGREALDGIINAARMAGGLVDGLLNLMRPPRPEPTDIHVLIVEMAPLFGSVVKDGVRVILTTGAEQACAHVDPRQLRQVLLNLVINADEAIEGEGQVSIETAQVNAAPGPSEEDVLILQVKDTGAGMDEDSVRKAFEPFFSTKLRLNRRGAGLGLASVHSAITQIGGSIEIASEPGRGTTVTLRLPLSEGVEVARRQSV
jgi:PAS domain S-box-containing protein